jgi:lipopolysaccharide transport system ATP-binding protein
VKRYSSGMQARLGFAIAAHLEPEVLVVDEVLSVGDASFQAKAFNRVKELVQLEIPVVVVSHQLEAITTLCTHALLLDRGRVLRSGTPAECIAAYLHGAAGARPPSLGDGALRIEQLRVSEVVVTSGETTQAELACRVRENGWVQPETVRVRVRLASTGDTLFETGTDRLGLAIPPTGEFAVTFTLQMNLAPGIYLVETLVWDRMMDRMSFVGPATYVEVRGGVPFEGVAQLNAHAALLPIAPGASSQRVEAP